ncbi:hypothetical protein PsYK624_165220 [Phanerochaete sordida]|uniref:Uncharacterized protein n=1 Tax=Phanerochaete sordida TaxID=48140 RepID=A0A9P3LM64_9APHY|nr:hypothetical protein PsYK624_165220 [Phanerochaete sordida]
MEYLKDARKTAERPRAQPVPSLAFGQRDLVRTESIALERQRSTLTRCTKPAAIHRVKRDQDSDASITRNPCGTTTGRPTVFGDEDLLAVMEYLKDARKTAETNISIG